jgi:hypothetical protein
VNWYGYWIKLQKVDSDIYYIEDKEGKQAQFKFKKNELVVNVANVFDASYKKKK